MENSAMSSDDPNRQVFLVTFPLLDYPDHTYSVPLDPGEDGPDNEHDAKQRVIDRIINADTEEAEEYAGLDTNPANVTCRRMTAIVALDALLDEGRDRLALCARSMSRSASKRSTGTC